MYASWFFLFWANLLRHVFYRCSVFSRQCAFLFTELLDAGITAMLKLVSLDVQHTSSAVDR